MVLRILLRPVLAVVAACTVAGCGVVEDPKRFENLARKVAEVPVSLERPGAGVPLRSADELGLRRPQPLRVEVMEPHDLWDARDGMVRQAAEAAAPVLAEAAVQQVAHRAPVLRRPSLGAEAGETRTVQLGAFSSRAAAEQAWSKAQTRAGEALRGARPRFETVQVGGRTLVRLKASVPSTQADGACAALGADRDWCRRGA